MINWKLYVEDYGKIKHAEIELAPLTLFVGDNNSGKSYLMSILWGIVTLGESVLFSDLPRLRSKSYRELKGYVMEQLVYVLNEKKKVEINLDDKYDLISDIINQQLRKNKDKLINQIFNSQDVTIGNLVIQICSEVLPKCTISMEGEALVFKINTIPLRIRKKTLDSIVFETVADIIIRRLMLNILDIKESILNEMSPDSIFFPAARTGFMLTKDTINTFSRKRIFDNILIDAFGEKESEIQPFTKPIIQFLDSINQLTFEKKGDKKYKDIIKSIEDSIIEGRLEISQSPNKEISYLPTNKKDKGLPLRITSAVVTELAPLVLLLKHKSKIAKIFYEEPEMCLHPQLQKEMGKILCRLVNSQTYVIATTHSDLILQHINNMIKLKNSSKQKSIFERYGYTEIDVIDSNQVRVYQLMPLLNGFTETRQIHPDEYGFNIPTFNNALDKITAEIYAIEDEE